MALVYDTTASNEVSSGTSLGIVLTPSYTTVGVVLHLWTKGGDIVTSVTYGGRDMTLADKQTASNGRTAHIYFMSAPLLGSQTCTITTSASERIRGELTSWTGTTGGMSLDTTAKNTWTGTTNTMSITTGVADCQLVSASADNRSTSSAGTNTTLLGSYSGSLNAARSTANVASAGATSLSYTVSSAETAGAYVVASFYESAAPSGVLRRLSENLSNDSTSPNTQSIDVTFVDTLFALVEDPVNTAGNTTGATIGGNAMTEMGRVARGGTNRELIIYGYHNTSLSGSQTLSVSRTSDSVGRFLVSAVGFIGTDTTSSLTGRSASSSIASTTSGSITLGNSIGDAICAISTSGSGGQAASTDTTELDAFDIVSTYVPDVEPADSASWQLNLTMTSGQLGFLGVYVPAASGGGGGGTSFSQAVIIA